MFMSSTDNPPSLALSDIMHHMSPSPGPPDEHVSNMYDFGSGESSKDANTSTEGYNQVDVAGVRRRLNELGYSVARQRNGGDSGTESGISPREKELLDMVLSLTDSVPIDPAQLERQAETISNLTTQRDFFARQAEEERERWNSERESWERTAEALLSLRNKPSKSEDVERLRVTYETENRVLRDKLQDTQKRLSSLESELLKLKPMLLMQPYTSSRQDKGKAREVDPARSNKESIPENRGTGGAQDKTQYYSYNHQPLPKITVNSPATASTSKTGAGAQPNPPPPRRRSRDHTGISKSQAKRNGPPLTSDAYTEHLLLAAKRIGRKRVAVAAGIMQHAEREKEALAQVQEQVQSQKDQERMEQERQERIANGTFGAYYRTGPEASTSSPQRVFVPVIGTTPLRTPKRGGIHFSNFASASNNLAAPVPDSPLVYVNVNPAATSYGSPWAGSGVMGTPGQIKATLNRQNGRANTEKAAASNPPTPLASLLDAALMMDEDDTAAASKLRGKGNGKGRALEEPESPVPAKRRKTSSAGKQAAGNSGKGLERVKTALDVLADQADQAAAAFNEPDQSDRQASVANGSNATLKGKGKAKEKPHNYPTVHDLEDEQNAEMEGEHAVDESGTVPQESTSISGRGRGKGTRSDSVSGTATQESTSTSGRGRGRGTRSNSAAGKTRTRAASTAASAMISSRPVRQASRKRITSPPDQPAAASTSAASATRGTGRGRGRSKGTTSKSRRGRSGSDAGPSRIVSSPGSRIISPPGPRVIAPAPGYSPLDEAIAMSSNIAAKAREIARYQSVEHEHTPPQRRPQVRDQLHLTPKIGGLRPVIGWGQRDMRSSFDYDSSPVRSSGNLPSKDKDDDEISQSGRVSEPSAPVAPGSTTESVTLSRSTPEISRHPEESLTLQSATLINGHVRDTDPPSASPQPAVTEEVEIKPSVAEEDIDADADADEDRDAEGEQEDDEDEEGEGEIVSTKHPSRSRSPPPPDPPPPGSDNGSPPDQDDEHDPDADAEGEVEFEDNEDHSGGMGTIPSSSRQAVNEHDLPLHSFTNTLFLNTAPFHNRSPSNPYSIDSIPIQTSAALRKHTPVLVDASDLSDNFNAAALGMICWVFANIPAKHESKRGWQTSESQVRVLAQRSNKTSFKWSKVDPRLGQIFFVDEIPQCASSFYSSLFFDSNYPEMATISRPLSSDIASFISPSLEVVS